MTKYYTIFRDFYNLLYSGATIGYTLNESYYKNYSSIEVTVSNKKYEFVSYSKDFKISMVENNRHSTIDLFNLTGVDLTSFHSELVKYSKSKKFRLLRRYYSLMERVFKLSNDSKIVKRYNWHSGFKLDSSNSIMGEVDRIIYGVTDQYKLCWRYYKPSHSWKSPDSYEVDLDELFDLTNKDSIELLELFLYDLESTIDSDFSNEDC